jgi:beta-xylosidase
VAISDHPGGPFIPEPSYIKGTQGTDPACFIDDDGQAYLFFGAHDMGRLKPNMTELDPTLAGTNAQGRRKVDVRNAPPVTDFMEGAWMHKHGDKYYYSWKQRVKDEATGIKYDAHYAVGDRVDGPFEYVGAFNRVPRGAQNHHSTVEIEGQWYFFYHVGGAGPKSGNRRMLCIAYLNHNPDGTIDLVEMGPEGVKILD